ncbi:MAG: hypothetical protein WDZ59_12190 [Pirellulales bacterium]
MKPSFNLTRLLLAVTVLAVVSAIVRPADRLGWTIWATLGVPLAVLVLLVRRRHARSLVWSMSFALEGVLLMLFFMRLISGNPFETPEPDGLFSPMEIAWMRFYLLAGAGTFGWICGALLNRSVAEPAEAVTPQLPGHVEPAEGPPG